jgi:hypothetical protein
MIGSYRLMIQIHLLSERVSILFRFYFLIMWRVLKKVGIKEHTQELEFRNGVSF